MRLAKKLYYILPVALVILALAYMPIKEGWDSGTGSTASIPPPTPQPQAEVSTLLKVLIGILLTLLGIGAIAVFILMVATLIMAFRI